MLKASVWLHRWLGIALCLLFAIWFASGAVLLFVPFPSLNPDEALSRAEPVPLDKVAVTPKMALDRLPGATSLRLIGVLGRPVYVALTPTGDRALDAASSLALPRLTGAQAHDIAARFAGSAVASVTGPLAYDQWIVHQGLDHARPMFRVRLRDPAATDLYVSARTGEVVQKTQGYERAWNWVGAVTHWIYFVPLRKVFTAWDWTVWSISLVGVAMAALGMGLGIFRTAKKMKSKRPAISPFKGWLKWHHILGLFGGGVVLTWIISGWLSMDHGRLFSRAASPEVRLAAYRGAPLTVAISESGLANLRHLSPAKSVRFNTVDGSLFVTPLGRDGWQSDVPVFRILSALQKAWPGNQVSGPTLVGPNDFYGKAEGVSPGTHRYLIRGGADTTVFIDPKTGEIEAEVNRSRAVYDWIYYALHTFNFPVIMGLPLLRDLIVLPLLGLGFALCVTSIVVSVRRLQILSQ